MSSACEDCVEKMCKLQAFNRIPRDHYRLDQKSMVAGGPFDNAIIPTLEKREGGYALYSLALLVNISVA